MSAIFILKEHLDAGLNSATLLDRLLVHIFHAKTSMLKRKLLSYSGFHYWKEEVWLTAELDCLPNGSGVCCTHMTLEYGNSLSPYTMLLKLLRTSSASQASENILLLQHLTGTCQARAWTNAEITAGSFERENTGWGWGNNPWLQDKFACEMIPCKEWKPQTGPNMRKINCRG